MKVKRKWWWCGSETMRENRMSGMFMSVRVHS
jgi:hypothetical protein